MKKRKHANRSKGLFGQPSRHPYRTLRELFTAFDLAGIRRELEDWQIQALCAAESAFEEGRARARLVRFCRRLLKLTEALWLLHDAHAKQTGKDWRLKLSPQLVAIAESNNQPVVLPASVKRDPGSVLKDFFSSHSAGYAAAILLDMMEAILLSHKNKKLQRPDLVFFYRAMDGFVRAGRELQRRQ